jgi:type I restriction enzyme, R subunit
VDDGATVPIYYESRLAKLALDENERPKLDEDFEEVTEGEEVARKEKLKSKWAALEAVVGTDKRLGILARDLVEHFEQRDESMQGKGLIVGMSRRICVELYQQLVRLRPDWRSDDDETGAVKVVMTGSASDPMEWQPHIRNKARRERLADRFKDPDDPLKLVIVRDMWLTGFDVPSLHTMYVDKPMRGHALMQAIARVNRVFRDKPGGLVVDYLGVADQLRQALAVYTESGGKGKEVLEQSEAVAVMLEKYEVVAALFHGFDYTPFLTGTAAQKLAAPLAAMQHVLAQENGQERFLKAVNALSKAFALAVPSEEALAIRDEVGFFQAVRATIVKTTVTHEPPDVKTEHAVRQLVPRVIAPQGVVDIFAAAGLQRPDISVLSDTFLAEVRDLPQKNVAIEVLRKLLNDELRTRSRSNLVQSRAFSQMLERTIRAYQNRALTTAEIIEQLIGLAKEMKAAQRRGEQLGLKEDELAFYDALIAHGEEAVRESEAHGTQEQRAPYLADAAHNSVVRIMGDETLRDIARELVATVRQNTTIDWMYKDSARARLRLAVKKLLRKYGYPPDKQANATETVLKQAELFSEQWTLAAA